MAGCCCVGQHNKSISAEPRVNLNAARGDHPAVVHLLHGCLSGRQSRRRTMPSTRDGTLFSGALEIAGQPRPPGGFSFGC